VQFNVSLDPHPQSSGSRVPYRRCGVARGRIALVAYMALVCASATHAQPAWAPFGAAPNTGGQVENMGDGEVSGAINAVAPHPADENILYVGAVNGGIWVTTNAMSATPSWKNLTDEQASLAIGALEFDPTDSTHKTLLAGTGGFSSFGSGGERVGLQLTTDGGATWKLLSGGGLPAGLNVSGVAPRGNTLVLSAVGGTSGSHSGIWRSTDKGATWQQVSSSPSSGLPAGICFDLASDPNDPKRLFANVGNRYYRSTDTGATWTKVSNVQMENMLNQADSVDASVGQANNIFVAIVGSDGRLNSVFHSKDGGDAWNDLGVPTVAGVSIHPGGQGSIHLSIASDPLNANLVYVGGDRQDGSFPFPNGIGARDYSGCLVRGDASKPPAQRWVHLTHSKTLGPAGGGTANGSAPHADSRDLDVAKNGVLIEGDDGGVYKRTNPQSNNGDWFSLNGNLQTAEYHAVAWDSNSDIVIAGAQDTGTGEQVQSIGTRFRSISTADGGVVAVDDRSSPGFSIRYSSNQRLGGLRRRVFDVSNSLISATMVPLSVVGGGAVTAQFYTPIALNSVQPERLIVGGSNGVYESLNQGDTCRRIAPFVANGSGLDTIAYGAAGNPDVLYVGSGDKIHVRTSPHPAPLTTSAYNGGPVMGVANDVSAPGTAFAISPGSVHRTTNAGATWTDLSSDLSTLKPGVLRSLAFIPAPGGGAGSVLVGSDNGVYLRQASATGSWVRLAKGLPRVPVYHLEYDGVDEILLAGTLGRGAWRLDTPSPGAALAMLAQVDPSPEAPAAPQAGGGKATSAAEVEGNPPTQLRDGVLVSPVNDAVYLMMPDGGVEAVQLSSGETLWSSMAAEKPLGVSGDVLISQAASPDGHILKIVALDSATGAERATGEQQLPPGVTPNIDESLEGAFYAAATRSGNDVFTRWQFVQRPTSGLPPGAEKGVAPGADDPTAAAPTALDAQRFDATSGVIQMNLTSGETASLNIELAPDAVLKPAENVVAQEDNLLDNVQGEQYRSADGQHVVVSVRTGTVADFHRYILSVYEAKTARKVAVIKSHVAIIPIAVVGERVVFESSPYVRRANDQLVENPLTIHVVDAKRNEVIWSRQVRDTTYQGPLPP
jgi:hypothetical protein